MLSVGLSSGAYYLAGYAIELKLKAIIAGDFKDGSIPDWRTVREIYTHNLPDLIRIAGLQAAIEAHRRKEPAFAAHWSAVRAWTEESRYSLSTHAKAANLIAAIEHPQDGVLAWLTRQSST